MPTPEPPPTHASSSSLPQLLSLNRLSWLRRALIVIGMAGPLWVWTREIPRSTDGAVVLLFLLPALVSIFLANANHTGAQIVARGIWWFNLFFGTVASVGARAWEPALLSCGAGLSLLSAWGAGLGSGEPTRGSFEPVAFRRSLLVSITMAVAEVQLLTMGAALLMKSRQPAYGAGAAACAVLLALGAYGIYRLRFWGVLLHLLTMVGVASLVGSALKHAHNVDPVMVWVAAVSVQMLLPMPMILAIVRKKPVRVGPPSATPARLFAAMVVLMMAASVVASALR
jgi:hypothetical protein